MQSARNQSGTVLIVVIMLLLLASVLTFFTLSTGVFEQHTSGNDLKAKMVAEVAEAGLAQGAEYLRSNPTFLANNGKWTQCTATDTFPCSSISTTARKVTMYHWSGGGYDFDGSGSISGWETSMLPITGPITTAGGSFAVQYGVGAVICHVAFKVVSTDPTVCTDTATASNTSIVTLVSVAKIPSEGASSTVTQSIGSYTLLNNLPGLPPIVASGSVNLSGGIQIVANYNGGGNGNPVSVWSAQTDTVNGTGNTCNASDWYSSGGTITYDPALPNFPLCSTGNSPSDCNCASGLSVTSGNKWTTAGIDILTATDHLAGGGNAGLHVDKNPALSEFPCDLFQKVFGVQAWEDDLPAPAAPTGGDGFCETHRLTTYINPNVPTQSVTMGVDEAYLYANATYIKAGSYTFPCNTGSVPACTTLAASALVSNSASNTQGDQTVASQSGLVWCQDGSQCASGTAAAPVAVVIDTLNHTGSKTPLTGTIFGLVFARSIDNTATYVAGATTSAVQAKFNPVDGGNAEISSQAGTEIYGSVVVQGTSGQMNGHSAVVSNPDVLTTLQGAGLPPKFVSVPGGWTDNTSY
jgi:hypothetical protein